MAHGGVQSLGTAQAAGQRWLLQILTPITGAGQSLARTKGSPLPLHPKFYH